MLVGKVTSINRKGGGIGLASGVLGAYFLASRRPVENYYRRLASVPIMASGVWKPFFLASGRPVGNYYRRLASVPIMASGVCVCVMLLIFGVQASRALDFRRPGVWGYPYPPLRTANAFYITFQT